MKGCLRSPKQYEQFAWWPSSMPSACLDEETEIQAILAGHKDSPYTYATLAQSDKETEFKPDDGGENIAAGSQVNLTRVEVEDTNGQAEAFEAAVGVAPSEYEQKTDNECDKIAKDLESVE